MKKQQIETIILYTNKIGKNFTHNEFHSFDNDKNLKERIAIYSIENANKYTWRDCKIDNIYIIGLQYCTTQELEVLAKLRKKIGEKKFIN